MGEIADMMLNGEMCQQCGEWLDGDLGYPGLCKGCSNENEVRYSGVSRKAKVNCPHCNKRVKKVGLSDHIRVVHTPSSVKETGK